MKKRATLQQQQQQAHPVHEDIEDLVVSEEATRANKKQKRTPVAAKSAKNPSSSSTSQKISDQSTDETTAAEIRTRLLGWYDENARKLPWRGSEPYNVWVSEIMCQQTKVDTVIPYFKRWMETFPTVEALATASLDDVNKVWAGLGYYRRARFLHEGAAMVLQEYKGTVPNTKQELMKIKGIGDYTSSAIASISFNERAPAVDGNVIRVYSRINAINLEAKDKELQKQATKWAQGIIKDCARPGDYNQASMELGAMVCTPRKPKCNECPVSNYCSAFNVKGATPDKIANTYPARPSAKAPIPERHVFVAVVTGEDNSVLATRRPNDGGLLSNQWELLCVEKDDTSVSVADIKTKLKSIGACDDCAASLHSNSSGQYKHIFSHLKHNVTSFRYDISTCKVKCLTGKQPDQSLKWIPQKDLSKAGLTRSMTKALEICGLLLRSL